MFFEMDLQTQRQPPHYVDARPSLGTRSWLTGQAVALRELSWKLAAKKDDRLAVRWKAMVWLLRKTEAGRKNLPDSADFAAMQTAADQMARDAARTNWTKGQTMGQLRDCLASHTEFADAKLDPAEHRRRAEVLVPAIDRLWAAWKKEGGADAPAFNSSLDALLRLAREQEDFDAPKFAAALRDLEGALAPAAQK